MRIDQTNYESFLLSYLDGELTEAENREVETFCAGHPEAARELDLLRQTVMAPTLTVFDNKASLYREEKKRRVIGWYLSRAAIVVVLLAGTAFLYRQLQPEPASGPDAGKLASVKPGEQELTKIVSDSGNAAATVPSPAIAGINAVVAKNTGKAPGINGSKEKNESPDRINPSSYSAHVLPLNKIKRFTEAGEAVAASGNKKNTPAIKGNQGDQAALNNVSGSDEEAALPGDARATQVDIATLHVSSVSSGKAISVTVNKEAGEHIAATSVRTAQSNPVSANDGPADADAAAPGGDDAVSVLHMAKSSGMVGKLFHRITGGGKQF